MKILIIEDEKMLADSLEAMLSRKGFDVETVYDGISGAEYAELGVYDLLILDVMMPGMNGYQVARQVRSRRCSTPILMLTATSRSTTGLTRMVSCLVLQLNMIALESKAKTVSTRTVQTTTMFTQ